MPKVQETVLETVLGVCRTVLVLSLTNIPYQRRDGPNSGLLSKCIFLNLLMLEWCNLDFSIVIVFVNTLVVILGILSVHSFTSSKPPCVYPTSRFSIAILSVIMINSASTRFYDMR